jgi:hypothetical protein
MNDAHGKSRKEESRWKAINQVKESSRRSENEDADQSYESVTHGLEQKDNFKNTSPAK